MDSLGYLSRCQEFSINGVPLLAKREAAEAYDEAVRLNYVEIMDILKPSDVVVE